MFYKIYSRLSFLAFCLAFLVVLFGAYVRLSNAGLGCPDWPGCYGKLTVPDFEHVEQFYPDSSLESHKAWKEMIHRYLAGSLGMMILGLSILSSLGRKKNPSIPLLIPWLLVGLVIFQALLGMWTVTIKLHPVVVMAHLLGGFATLGLLWWNYLSVREETTRALSPLRPWIFLGLVLLLLQISLGAWTSTNYASLACPDFPTCQGKWIPPLNFQKAFHLGHEFGPNYEGGVLNNEERMTIHFMHRVGAFIVFIYLSILSLKIFKRGVKKISLHLGAFLLIQISLGISNIVFHLPLPIAVAHNGVAALLFLTLITLVFVSKNIKNS